MRHMNPSGAQPDRLRFRVLAPSFDKNVTLGTGVVGKLKREKGRAPLGQAAPPARPVAEPLSGNGCETRMVTPQTKQFGDPTCSMTAGRVLNSRPQRGQLTLTITTNFKPAQWTLNPTVRG